MVSVERFLLPTFLAAGTLATPKMTDDKRNRNLK